MHSLLHGSFGTNGIFHKNYTHLDSVAIDKRIKRSRQTPDIEISNIVSVRVYMCAYVRMQIQKRTDCEQIIPFAQASPLKAIKKKYLKLI